MHQQKYEGDAELSPLNKTSSTLYGGGTRDAKRFQDFCAVLGKNLSKNTLIYFSFIRKMAQMTFIYDMKIKNQYMLLNRFDILKY
jgi:hypothetical protein